MDARDLFPSAPTTWERTTLGEICSRGGGGIQTGPFGSQLHASDYVPVGIPSIMPVNIGDNRIVPEGIARILESDAERLSKHRVKPGDVIYSRRGDVERRALIRNREDGWLCGTGCLKVRFGYGVINPAFASFFLGHPEIRAWIVRHAVGATMPNLNTAIMEAIPFLLPPITQQDRIADILGSLDDKIELNRRMNETLEAMTRVTTLPCPRAGFLAAASPRNLKRSKQAATPAVVRIRIPRTTEAEVSTNAAWNATVTRTAAVNA